MTNEPGFHITTIHRLLYFKHRHIEFDTNQVKVKSRQNRSRQVAAKRGDYVPDSSKKESANLAYTFST